MCRVYLPIEATNMGLTEEDVRHMLKACDEYNRIQYEPTWKELKDLILKAYKEESARKRLVTKWAQIVARIN